jgi:hypothetical protein
MTILYGFCVVVITIVLEALQPIASVPTTVYVPATAGVNVVSLVKVAFAFQVYVFAPPPCKVTGLPAHTVSLGVAKAVTVGNGFTVTANVAVDEQPAEVPVTV